MVAGPGPQVKGLLWSAAGALLAAGYLIPYKAATDRADATALALPMLIAAALLNSTAVGVQATRKKTHWNRTSLVVAVLIGILSAVGNEAMAHALARIGPGLASVTLRTQVILVALGGWWLLSERVGYRFWIGVTLALGGFVLLRLGPGEGIPPSAVGMWWAFLAAVSFGAIQLVVRKTIARIDMLVVNGLRLWIAAVLLACIPGRVSAALQIDGTTWLLLAGAAAFGPIASRLCLMAALNHIQAALSTLVLFLAPVFAFALGGLVFGVWPTWLELVASGIILGGVAWPVLGRLKRERTLDPGFDA